MNNNIIAFAKDFEQTLRSDMKAIDGSDLFAISITGDVSGANEVSVALYSDVKVGSIARDCFPDMYQKADEVIKCANEVYGEISGVILMRSKGRAEEVQHDKKVLRICILDA